ncbi:TnsA endonuclease N-terminal domain-containing protein [bacterium]|nr:TnsA endonuclease N-terminal domain-containing protein [bacterium]|tara:strand:+ start:71 stop:541 length:471 start_codon:yes stop_codon:yes gene_type:complete
MGKFATGKYDVVNKSKFVGGKNPTYRSSWELAFMRMCDAHPNVTKWASENVKIPYKSPIDGKYHNYVPDFMLQYTDKNGTQHVELIEIKPANQTTMENAKSRGQQIQTHINAAKWTAAQEWCSRKGIRFKVINEDQIFQNNKPRKSRKRVAKKRVK